MMAIWAQSLAKADFRTSKGLDELVDHILTEHDGKITDFKKMFANAKVTLMGDWR